MRISADDYYALLVLYGGSDPQDVEESENTPDYEDANWYAWQRALSAAWTNRTTVDDETGDAG